MIGTLLPSNPLAVLVILLFALSVVLDYTNHSLTRHAHTASWSVFALFWANLIEHFLLVKLSAIEGILTIAAVPACLLVAYHTHTNTRSYTHITKAILVMALIYFPVVAVTPLQQALIETVANQVNFILTTLGYDPTIIPDEHGFESTFQFYYQDRRYLTTVLLACTGLGSTAIVLGLISATPATLTQKLTATAITVPIIWVLNLVRVTFITLAQSFQWFQIGVDFFVATGIVTDPHSVSFLIADRILAQSLSVVALIAIVFGLLKIIPELTVVLNEVTEPLLNFTLDPDHFTQKHKK